MNFIGNKYLGDSDRAIRMVISKKLQPYGLDGSKFIFFMAICRMPGLSQSDLVRITLFDKTVVTRNVSKLIELGLASKEDDEDDRRLSHIFPTEKGREIFDITSNIIMDLNKRIYASLSIGPEELEKLLFEISLRSRAILNEECGIDCIE